jgi:hypothetical protein
VTSTFLLRHRLLSEARKAQQGIGETQQLLAAAANVTHEFFLLRIQRTWPFVAQDPGEADDSMQMPAQVV